MWSAILRSDDVENLERLYHKLRMMADMMPADIACFDAEKMQFIFVNVNFAKTYGLQREQVVGAHVADILTPEAYQTALPYIELARQGRVVTYEGLFRTCLGERWFQVTCLPECDWTDSNRVTAIVTVSCDISEYKAAKRDLQESEAKYRRIVETSLEGILTYDKENRITYVNQRILSMLGYRVEDVLGSDIKHYLPPEEIDDHLEQMSKIEQGRDRIYERRLLNRDGSKRWIRVSAKSIFDESGQYNGAFAMLTDIHAFKLAERELKRMVEKLKILSYTDGLTGIANRRYFDGRLMIEFKRRLFNTGEISILMIDVDHFKTFNDHYGHLAGDECLRKIAAVIADIVSAPSCLAARFGGEEFACLLPGYNNRQAINIAEKIRSSIENLRIVHSPATFPRYITVSVGVATARYSDRVSAHACLRVADAALYQAKNKGRNCVQSD